jgi:hypothetical protein
MTVTSLLCEHRVGVRFSRAEPMHACVLQLHDVPTELQVDQRTLAQEHAISPSRLFIKLHQALPARTELAVGLPNVRIA